MSPTYLKDLVERRLAELGAPGTVTIRPRVALAERWESGERVLFVIEYRGDGTAHLLADEWEISCGTVLAPVAEALAEKILKARRFEQAA